MKIPNKIIELVNELGWDYDRMSSSGQETYDKLEQYIEDNTKTVDPLTKKMQRYLLTLPHTKQIVIRSEFICKVQGKGFGYTHADYYQWIYDKIYFKK